MLQMAVGSTVSDTLQERFVWMESKKDMEIIRYQAFVFQYMYQGWKVAKQITLM